MRLAERQSLHQSAIGDSPSRSRYRQAEARAEERAALLITHDLVLGARFAHELLLIDAGRVVARGAPADVLTEERIAAVYGVEARVTRDEAERVVITAVRSRFTERFGYPPGRDESHR